MTEGGRVHTIDGTITTKIEGKYTWIYFLAIEPKSKNIYLIMFDDSTMTTATVFNSVDECVDFIDDIEPKCCCVYNVTEK